MLAPKADNNTTIKSCKGDGPIADAAGYWPS